MSDKDNILGYMLKLSASQRLVWLGTAGMVVSALSHGFMGYQVDIGMQHYVLIVSAVIALIGWYGTQKDIQRSYDLKIQDAKLRQTKLDAGLDPELDKTIIKFTGDELQ